MDTSLHVYVVLFCSVHAVKALPSLVHSNVGQKFDDSCHIYIVEVSHLHCLSLGTAIAISDCKISFVFLPPTL